MRFPEYADGYDAKARKGRVFRKRFFDKRRFSQTFALVQISIRKRHFINRFIAKIGRKRQIAPIHTACKLRVKSAEISLNNGIVY